MWDNLSLVLAAVVCIGMIAEAAPANAQTRRVTINQVALTVETLSSLERQYRVHIAEGDYWYDPRAGLWGMWGGPAVAAAVPNLDTGGPLTRDASGGIRTGVIVNGRELHPLDVAALQRIMPVLRGRYWMDASGWGGYEGGPPLFNVWALAAHAQPPHSGDRSWIHRGPGGGMGSDGQCIYYIGREGSASTGC